MKDCLKYLIILFVLSVFLSKMVEDKEDTVEGLVNLLNIKVQDVLTNPALAGSIGETYSPEFLKGSCQRKKQIYNNYKIYDPGEYERNLFDIETRVFDENLRYKLKNFVPVDYAPYEVILPPKYQKDMEVEDPGSRKRYFINADVTENTTDDIYGVEDEISSENDCQGKFSDWDETNCTDPKNRCQIKYRTYEVTKERKSAGRNCKHEGRTVKDGDIDYGYCYGSDNMNRCGATENLCQCDLENYSAENCNMETMQLDCQCPSDGYRKVNGKCVNLANSELNNLLVRLSFYNLTHHRN